MSSCDETKGLPKSHIEESAVNRTNIYCNLKQFEAKT